MAYGISTFGIGGETLKSSDVWGSIEKKLMSRIVKQPDGCWIWQGATSSSGYGHFMWDGQLLKAHRVSYEVHIGPIPKGLWVIHKCDVRACCCPDHLSVGTDQDNADDRETKGRGVYLHGQSNGRAMLTDSKVREIRRLLAACRHTGREIGNMFGVSEYIISDIKRGKSWRHV
jgi:hypothetical protein